MEFYFYYIYNTPLNFALSQGNVEITKLLLQFKSSHLSNSFNSNEKDLFKLSSFSLQANSKKEYKDSSISNSIPTKKDEEHLNLTNTSLSNNIIQTNQTDFLKEIKQKEEVKETTLHSLNNSNKENEQVFFDPQNDKSEDDEKPIKKLPKNRTKRHRRLHIEEDQTILNHQPQTFAQDQFYYPAQSDCFTQLNYQPQIDPQIQIYNPPFFIQNQLNYQQQEISQLMQINQSLQTLVNLKMMHRNEMQDELNTNQQRSKKRRRNNRK